MREMDNWGIIKLHGLLLKFSIEIFCVDKNVTFQVEKLGSL